MALALYRRYRPDTFDGVIGQKQVTVPLSRALDAGKLTHAYLFSGPRGCGKTSSARIFARGVNCVKGPTSHPCGECDSCRDLATGGPGSIDVVEIDAASHNGVDDARELRERAGFAPVRDRYKIFILDEAHMVTQQGFNALLKIVEEPPEHVMFIFATTEPEKVISTIRSRTHHYPFRLVPQEVMEPYLESICEDEKIEAEPGVLKLAMRAGGGSVRDTLSVLDQLMVGADQGEITYDAAVTLLGYTPESLIGEAIDAVIEGDGPKLYGVVQHVVIGGFEPKRFVEDLLQRVRDLLVLTLAGAKAEGVLSEDAGVEGTGDMERQAKALGMGRLTRIADIIDDALASMSGAISPRMRLELLAARLLVPDSELAPTAASDGRAGTSMVGAPAGAGFIGAKRQNPSAPRGDGRQEQAPGPSPVAQGPTQSGAPRPAPQVQAQPSGHADQSVDQRWDALVAALPDGVKEYVVREKVPRVALRRNPKGRLVLALTFDQPLSQHAFALAVAARAVDGETKVPNIVMVRARQEFGPDTMIAPSGVAANGEKVESVARMSPERRSEVKKRIALARTNMSAMNLGVGVAPHTASEAAGQPHARGQQHSSQGSAQEGESAGDASDSDAHHASGPGSDAGRNASGSEPVDQGAGPSGGPIQGSSPLSAAGFASTESYVRPDELDDDDPWATPSSPTVDLGPHGGADGSQSQDQEEAEAERKARKMGLPDLSDQDDPWASHLASNPASVQTQAPDQTPVLRQDSAQAAEASAETSRVVDHPTPIEDAPQSAPVEAPAAPVADTPASPGPDGDHGSFVPPDRPQSDPQVPPDEDEYSLNDARQGEESLMGPKELAKMFDVKKVEDLSADDPKNPLNINKRKRQQGFEQ
ncbi:DNA polymerase III gamma and tau subunit [Bifidobacterium actinocoloniiforme DSM 22766]|uniref:DNA-directed DNA polymerase n=1 Tax=Bifidobacterium actinocoloniiforme DSM 22766 TaxID=1437605 RepID=A0A086Z2B5_9BIFI|nr:DNA polymerase III subunit gamma/tau [Bifidobacterium actinocoloniiforme]AKV55680.1 hypothetical protein AB656_05175 [Bifidobacterium actinocoloniiforme DSM 22766]KFI40665.1 DNA polymerase III gamma and tau subunit [Bifidobacterium actinocoloniiforme DSM 22766]